ncbi:MAG: tyrosine--tRNA ligase [Acidobacteria bacterium]|nr:tyrosine--tRNA ligase [Acidobacteriota bacterium]
MDLFREFEWREMVYDATDGARDALRSGQVTGYIGFDPTADSLHVGSLLPVMALARFQRAGHAPIAIVGGGTGLIGDPSGKTQERQLLTTEQVEANVVGIRRQLERFLDFDRAPNAARIVNNADWLVTIPLMTFLRDIGKHFTVNYLLQKESVKRRLESEEGISYTEFSYLLTQAYDFVVLHDRFGCTLQMGGSDQWGNITAGIDLIRKLRGAKAHGIVLPLVTTASGVKFGKTEVGTVWLDAARTSPFRFYQFWLNTDDRDAVRYLKFFTFLDETAIEELARASEAFPERRDAQRALAAHVTDLAHGPEQRQRAEAASALLFKGDVRNASKDDILTVFEDVPSTAVDAADFGTDGLPVTRLITLSGLEPSTSAAVRLVKGGGFYVNDARVSSEKERVGLDQAIEGEIFVLRKGQRDRRLIRVRKSH